MIRYIFGLFVLRRADSIRVVAKRIEKTLRKKKVHAAIKCLPVSVDVSRFVNSNSFESDKNDFEFLSVARFVPQKNLDLLLSAFKEVHEMYPHTRLRLVGSGLLESWVKDFIAHNFSDFPVSPVVVESWSNDVPALMKEADVYLLSSNYEGWARALIEAKIAL